MTTNEPLDFLFQPIRIGRKVVYSTTWASSPVLTLAEVVDVVAPGTDRFGNKREGWKIKVKRIRDHTGVLLATGGYSPDRPEPNYRNSQKVITLTFPTRMVVVHPEAT